jgi:hypothetical protein
MTIAASGHIGGMIATLALDGSTGNVIGQLTREKPRDADEQRPTPMVGVRDVPGATPGGPGACIAPGTYELTFDPGVTYKSDAEDKSAAQGEKRCDTRTLDKLRVRLEYLGPHLYGDSLDEHGKEDWPSRTVIKSFNGSCDVELEHHGEDGSAHVIARLTIAGSQVSGTASEATYRVLEDGEAGERMWNCTAANVAITGRRL